LVQEFLYGVSWALVRMYALMMLRLDIRRHGQLPSSPMIFVANHPSATDPFMIHMISRKQLNVLITAKAFSVPFFGWFLREVQEIPVPLNQGSTALEQARQHINKGRSIAIFIEGTISPMEGGFHSPRSGAARLAISTGTPVVPVGIFLRRDRCHNIRSKISGEPSEARWFLRGPYAITVGKPTRFEGNAEDREHVRHISEVIMENISSLAHESEQRIHNPNLMPAPG
jgi:1-acyl-sn-glycerol-3-phosphate acyltransferase